MYKSGAGALSFLGCFGAALVFLYGCAGTPPAPDNREAEAVAAANAALGALNGGSLAGPPAAGAAASPAPVNSGKKEPAWLRSPDAVYNRNTFVAAVGSGGSRDQAEKNAFAALASIFRQSLRADQTLATSYRETLTNGVSAGWTEISALDSAVQTSAAMELVGAEIRDLWSDGKTVYAAAVMEKARTAPLYTRMILDNQKLIDTLVAVPDSERNTMDGLARFQFAATLADLNKVFANVLSVIGAPVPAGMKRPEEYRLAASAIMKTIPVSVAVEHDSEGRIRSAFASALSALGFRTGGNNSRYQIQARIFLTEAQLPNQPNAFVRYVVDGNFKDTVSGAILFPYSINGREGHVTIAEAEARAVRAAETKIKDGYADALSAFLSRLIPEK